MKRSTNIVIAAVVAAIYTLYALAYVGIALATQNQNAKDMGNGFLVVLLILFTVCLVSIYGVWQNQKWGKILVIIPLGLNALLALPGVIVAPTLPLKLEAASGVVVAIVVTVLLLSRPKEASAA
jgi:hypothetical protein